MPLRAGLSAALLSVGMGGKPEAASRPHSRARGRLAQPPVPSTQRPLVVVRSGTRQVTPGLPPVAFSPSRAGLALAFPTCSERFSPSVSNHP